MEPIIRVAREGDIPRIVELYDRLVLDSSETERQKQCNDEVYRRAFNEIGSDPRHHLLVSEYDGKVVGTLVFVLVPNLSHRASPWAVVENVIVDPAYQGRGFGKKMMEHVIEMAKEAGCYKISLTSNLKRHVAHNMYRSLGFEPSAHGFRRYF